MRITIRYLTTFTYDTHVSESQNALRAKPASDGRQRLIDYSVTVDPKARIYSYTDYWGTQVDCFGVIGRHTRLTVVADSVVETFATPEPVGDGAWPPQVGWDAPEAEYLTTTPHVASTDEIVEFARDLTAGADSAVVAAQAVQRGVGEHLKYVTGSTDIGVTVAEVFNQGTGVCQDYAHLALAVYRSLGMPARYVSGYLYAADAAAGERPDDNEIDVSTHAWVEVLVPEYGWWGLDPTNQKVVGEQHVKIGHGRDYEDVMPLRGVYHGDAESGGLEAGVTMSRATLDPYAMQPRPVYVRRQEQQQQQQQ
jgi:transglutaminase-like putative cysteine protease